MKISELMSETGNKVWVSYNKEIDFLIDIKANKEFQIAYETIKKEKFKKLRGKKEPAESSDFFNLEYSELDYEIRAQILANFVLKNWRGIKNNNGKELAYDIDISELLLRKNKRIFNFILQQVKATIILERKSIEAARRHIELLKPDKTQGN